MKSKKVKKMTAALLAATMCASFSMVALAGDDDDGHDSVHENVPGYGEFHGCSHAETNYGMVDTDIETTLSQNPDNAYLRVNVAITNIYGQELDSAQSQSSRGETSFPCSFRLSDDSATSVFATHSVEGGSIYAAQAIYTRADVVQEFK